MIKRHQTKTVNIGPLTMGGTKEVLIQTMAKSRPSDFKKALDEIHTYATEGAALVRFSVVDIDDAKALKTLKAKTNVPLVADIHFDYKLALEAIKSGVDKIRINPGNIGNLEHVRAILKLAKEHQTVIRIGINLGSLEKPMQEKYGKSAKAMVKSAEKYVGFFEENHFKDIVLSFKASDVKTTIEANMLAAKTFDYPLHLGLTEAGPTYQGTITSSAALGTLLYHGIGNTIRISLSSDRLDELKACKTLLASLDLCDYPKLISCPTCGRLAYDMEPVLKEIEAYLEKHPTKLKIAVMGCAVNGPGEAKDADIGIAGGKEEALLFIKGKIVKKVPQHKLTQALIEAIESYRS